MILLRPVGPNFSVTQGFGENPEDYPATNGHNGIDFGGPEGNPVRAAAAGQVTRVDLDPASVQNPMRGYGFQVRILHPDGTTTLYAHLLEGTEVVSTGQQVRMGDLLAKSGGVSGITGFSTGAHIHFELRLTASVTSGVNPAPLMVDKIPSEAGLFTVRITPEGDKLKIRTGPGTTFNVVRKLQTGDEVKAFSLSGNNIWLQVEEGFIMYKPEWVAINQEG